MIEQRELITVCRQIGSMMEAGLDILRITRVLRAQTDNPRVLRCYETLDHDLRMGMDLPDAMERVPEMFSPFAISLVRQGDARNDLAGAFHKIAEFLQKEDESDYAHDSNTVSANGAAFRERRRNDGKEQIGVSIRPQVVAPSALLPVWVIEDLINRAQVAALRIFTVIAGLLISMAAVWAAVEAGLLERRWENVVLCCVAALFIGGTGVWLRRTIEGERQRGFERHKFLEDQAARVFDENAQDESAHATQDPDGQASAKASPSREATFE